MDLFYPCATGEDCSREFLQVQTTESYASARRLAERVFSEWRTRRKEFVRDFRSHGYSARLWELALFGYFSERDFDVDMNAPSPDFIVTRDGLTIAIEATTSNPPRNAVGKVLPTLREALPNVPRDVAQSEVELIFQLGKALRRKTSPRGSANRPYWESEHLLNSPFVIAVEAFHGETSLFHGDTGLASYLFGYRWQAEHSTDGSILIHATPVKEHDRRGKVIPSGFFFQPGMDHVSAVLFSNAATISQFLRIGLEHGYGAPGVVIVRQGTCLNHDPNALEPATFQYTVERGEHRETFATGIRVLHNPVALYPIPDGYFSGVVEMRLQEDGLVTTSAPVFAPFSSVTYVLAQGNEPRPKRT